MKTRNAIFRENPLILSAGDRIRFQRVSEDELLQVWENVRADRYVACCLDSGELACQHRRSFARHRTVTALEHARAPRELRGAPPEPEVELRPLARYDQLIPA